MTGHVATVETDIRAPRSAVWRALTDPDEIEKYMFGSRVETDWKPGSRITWKGEYEGKTYEDNGENYHTLLYELEESDGKTHVSLSQDNNKSEEAAEHSRANWDEMLSG